MLNLSNKLIKLLSLPIDWNFILLSIDHKLFSDVYQIVFIRRCSKRWNERWFLQILKSQLWSWALNNSVWRRQKCMNHWFCSSSLNVLMLVNFKHSCLFCRSDSHLIPLIFIQKLSSFKRILILLFHFILRTSQIIF